MISQFRVLREHPVQAKTISHNVAMYYLHCLILLLLVSNFAFLFFSLFQKIEYLFSECLSSSSCISTFQRLLNICHVSVV